MAEEPKLAVDLIVKRAIAGIVAFIISGFFIQLFNIFGNLALSIILDPAVFGIFAIVSSLLNILVYFSDIGLAAALVQKKEEPTQGDLTSTFTLQQIIIFTIVILGLLFSQSIAKFYKLDSDGLMLLRVLFFSLILSSLKTIPSILLERKLNFVKLIIPQIVENVVFFVTAVTLALLGHGVASFTWAVLARGIVGLYLIYALSPWMPRVGLNKLSTKNLTSFGLPFQLNSTIALIKDDLLTVFLGKVLTFAEVGYIGWAQQWAFRPLRFFMDSVNRVIFPAYSRLQDHKEDLAKAVEKSIFFVTFFVYPSLFGLIAIAPNLVSLIPRYQKWEPALPLLYLFAINAVFSAVSTTCTNALFATGRPKIVLKFMVFWTSATWILTYPLITRFGYIGVGISSAIVASTSIAMIYFVKKEIPIKVGKNILGPLFISMVMFFAMRFLLQIMNNNFPSLILTVIIGASIYLISSFAIFRKSLINDSMVIVNSIISRK
ncbi:MAG TPA: oligosaccharide flippase family protein [Candidatus Saccharimonadales bacterium]|nr:oligosaccharide flippase family protein [Candidatus Saccharimonadales bacterium]